MLFTNLFHGIISLPDISKWDYSNVKEKNKLNNLSYEDINSLNTIEKIYVNEGIRC